MLLCSGPQQRVLFPAIPGSAGVPKHRQQRAPKSSCRWWPQGVFSVQRPLLVNTPEDVTAIAEGNEIGFAETLPACGRMFV